MVDLGEPRRAGVADVDGVLRLRELMLGEMGADVATAEWRAPAREWFAERLRHPGEFAVFAVEDPAEGLISCAAGSCESRAPTPSNPAGRTGRVFNMSTLPAHRGRGHGRRCLEALLAWFRTTDVREVHLNATEDGIGLYRSLGFAEPAHPALLLHVRS